MLHLLKKRTIRHLSNFSGHPGRAGIPNEFVDANHSSRDGWSFSPTNSFQELNNFLMKISVENLPVSSILLKRLTNIVHPQIRSGSDQNKLCLINSLYGKPPPMAARLEKALPFRRECCRSLGSRVQSNLSLVICHLF
jgi:hypothetical protein